MKRISVILLIALIVSLLTGFTPIGYRGTERVCNTQIDCGFDIIGTDYDVYKSYGWPLAVTTYRTVTDYDLSGPELGLKQTTTRSKLSLPALVINWLGLSVMLLAVTVGIAKLRGRSHAHTRH